MKSLIVAIIIAIILIYLLDGCCSSRNTTVITKDTTVTTLSLKDSTGLFVLDNYTFSGTKKDTLGDTTWTVRVKIDSSFVGSIIASVDTMVNGNEIVKAIVKSIRKHTSSIGSINLDVKPSKIQVTYPQTINTTISEPWYNSTVNKILIWLTVVIIALFILKQIFK